MSTSPSLPPDSPSSDSSPSLPFRPFSRLPTELVQHIIESTVPLSFYSKTYHDRQTTLRSLCLTSRLFRQIAQPVLFAVVKLAPGTQHNLFEKEADKDGAAKWTQELAVKCSIIYPGQNDVEPLLKVYTGLRTLALSAYGGAFHLNQLSRLDNLSVLRLSRLELHDPVHCVLTSLRELSLLAVKVKAPLHHVLNPSAFPSLRALSFWAIYAKDLSELQVTFDLFDNQLDIVSLGNESLAHLSGKVLKHLQTKTLWDQDLAALTSFPNVPYLRIFCELPFSLQDILYFTSTVEITATPLPSLLYLPSDFDPSAHLDSAYVQSLVDFAAACKERKVEIVYEQQAANWEFDLGFSQDFWRRMKVQKSVKGQ